MIWLEILCLKFRFALHIYFRTSLNYLTSQERTTMAEAAPTSTHLHRNTGQRSNMPKTNRHKHNHSDTAVWRVGTNRSAKCLHAALFLCVRVINIHTELDCIQPALQDSDNSCLYVKASHFMESCSFTNNSSEVQKIPLFLRYWVVYLWFI